MSTTTQEYQVTGLTCGHCVASVKEELGELTGVTSVEVELHNGGVSLVTVESVANLITDEVRAAIDEAGYTLVTPVP